MGVISAALRELMAVGLEGDALWAAVDRIERAMGGGEKPRSSGAERQARYRARKAEEQNEALQVTPVTSQASQASQTVTSDEDGDKKECPHTPIEKTTPYSDLRSDSPPNSKTENADEPETLAPKRRRRSRLADLSDDFGKFYAAFPKHVAPKDAEKAYAQAIREGADHADLLAAAKRYAAQSVGVAEKYIKAPAGWIRAGRWLDGAPIRDGPAKPDGPAKVWVDLDSEAGMAWKDWTHKTTGRFPPRDQKGGWWFDTEWPPETDEAKARFRAAAE